MAKQIADAEPCKVIKKTVNKMAAALNQQKPEMGLPVISPSVAGKTGFPYSDW